MTYPTIYNHRVTERGNKDSKILTTYIEPETFRRLKVQGAVEGRSMTAIVEELIEEYLKRKEK